MASTVTTRPTAPRVEEALRAISHFESIPTEATAYDASIAAGPAHLVVAVNFRVVVLSKANGQVVKEADLFAWFDSELPTEVDTVFDPRVLYDQYEGRWVLAASAVHYGTVNTPDFFTLPHLVLSVSHTSDPTGDWWTWSFPEERPRDAEKIPWPDHPSLGVDPHALYLSANVIGAPSPARLWVIAKTGAYTGGVVSYKAFAGLQNPTDKQHKQPTPALTVFPCHTWGNPGVQYLVSTRKDAHDTEDSIILWRVKHTRGEPQLEPAQLVGVPAYGVKMPSAPQKDDGHPIHAGGDARVRSAVYLGGSVWFAFAASDGTVGVARWYQLDPTTLTLAQKGNYAVPNVYHCYPAIVPDMHGNAAFVVGRAKSDEYLSLHVSARKVTDPPGTLPPTVLLHPGLAVHEHLDVTNRNRWGDYHSAALDPSDGTTVWVCGAYPVTAWRWGVCVAGVRV